MTSASEHTLYCRVQPVPPPTVNRLTSRQKAQLRRSTTKLAKVLGEAPQVVDDLSPRVPYVSAPKKLQPSLSITSGKAPLATTPRRARSAATRGRIDPDLYPLSATLRPVSCDVRRSSESRRSRRRSHSSSFSQSVSSEYLVSENENGKEDDEKSSFIFVSTRPQTRPDSVISTTTKSRDSLYSLCDSAPDYEPTFRIPSATKIRREKMARVCKILGEDVPVHLVFPIPRTRSRSRSRSGYDDLYSSSESSSGSSEEISSSSVESDVVIDICAPPPFPPTPQKGRQMPPPSALLKLKRKPVPKPPYEDEELNAIVPDVPLKPSKPPVPPKSPELQQHIQTHMPTQAQTPTQRWQSQPQHPHPLTYRASRPNLETIIEQSPRASYSSSASADTIATTTSRCSLLTNTTSSSYRFTSSGCLSSSFEYSPVSSEAHEIAPLPTPIPIHAPTKAETATPAITATRIAVPVSNSTSPNPSPNPDSRSTAAKSTNDVSSLSSVTSFSSSSGTHNRREFAIYAPFRRLRSSTTPSTSTANNSDKDSNNVNRSQECELVRGMLDLRV